MAAYHDPAQLAKALGGESRNGQILAPGPGHSATDRSLSIRIDANAPHGFVVHSFAGDDPIKCRDYIYERAGLPAWKPNGGKRKRASSDAIDAAIMAATAAVGQQSKSPRGQIVATYDYVDAGGTLLYQVLARTESLPATSTGRQRRMDLERGRAPPRSVPLARSTKISRRHRFHDRR